MILPDGYSDVPAGKIAAVVTHLEMTERPTLPHGTAPRNVAMHVPVIE